MSTDDLIITAAVLTVTLLLFVAGLATLLVLNHTRRIRHRAELAELQLRRDQEVMAAEREATQQTLREVGRELHDNVGQLLTVAQMGLNTVLEEPLPDTRLAASRDALDQGIEEVRRLGHSLNSDLWQQGSLADAISAEAERVERVGRVAAHVIVKGTLPVLSPDTSTILFRVFQEVVNNALKHSGADTLTITLSGSPTFCLTVADNGKGFDATRTVAQGGLVNIPRRCALVGFSAQCTTAPGLGCVWTLEPTPAHGT